MQAVRNTNYVNVHSMERLLSIASGSVLALSGVRKGRTGVPQLIAGALIVRRGLSGHCEVYRALGVGTTPSDASVPYELGVRARAAVSEPDGKSNWIAKTEIRVSLRYNPPAGLVGAFVAKLFASDPEHQIAGDLNRLRQYLEAGHCTNRRIDHGTNA